MARKRRFKVREHQLYTVLPRVWKELRRENQIDKVYRFRDLRISIYSKLFSSGFWLQRILEVMKPHMYFDDQQENLDHVDNIPLV